MSEPSPSEVAVMASQFDTAGGQTMVKRIFGLAIVVALAFAALVWLVHNNQGRWSHRGSARKGSNADLRQLPFDPEKLQVSDPAALEALTVEQAIAANAARPATSLPIAPGRALIVPQTNALDYQRSLDCLSAAIYYEAAYEPVDGQRAVAQVILNRLRHPLYPHTVCGVVFQGSERMTGCQFTFSCDGSLARVPSRSAWAQSRTVAEAALKGLVYKPIGLATHYHADYVVPYWASSLVKVSTIGKHIFYRIDGIYGSLAAFNRSYAGNEPPTFERDATGTLVLLNPPSPGEQGPTVVPEIRALSANGGALAQEFGALTASAASSATASSRVKGETTAKLRADYPVGPDAKSRAGAVPGDQRWVIGMDGAARHMAQGAVRTPQDQSPINPVPGPVEENSKEIRL
jgi:spore germination cell wall hydrolase CwlJ-like protein